MTDITPIKDDAAYRAALAEIDRLWGSAAGTAEGDRLDVLMTLVDAYEPARWPVGRGRRRSDPLSPDGEGKRPQTAARAGVEVSPRSSRSK